MPGIQDGLTQPHARAAALRGPVLVLAGAGTGKTRTLTAAVAHRIAHDGIPSGRILAVTFTNKAAAEMLDRIRAALGDQAAPRRIGTFHGLGARQLRSEPEVAGLRPGFDFLDADDTRRTVKRVMKAMNLNAGDEDNAWSRDPLKLVCNRISRGKDELVTPEEAPDDVERIICQGLTGGPGVDPASLRTAVRVYLAYQRTLRDGNAADFGDLLLWPARAMLGDSTYRARWAGRFDAIAADEYQDVNRAQYEWLRALSSRDVFVVGDDDQSIYSWRGADVTFIRQ
jgi:DNA helicase II / ATP-dependent DNA helicase PcrA